MTISIDTQQTGIASTLHDAANRRKGDADKDAPLDRTVRDTVSLSYSGQTIVNLNRGADLGKQIKDAAVDENFAARLKRATDDVFRINKLFGQTMRSLFGWWKS
ncbi:MAG: hypothetical protein ACTSV1_10400 [Alphaproteobacteria bacterium]